MKAYSIDLRERIVHAVESGQPKSVVARLFRVGRTAIDRFVQQYRATGDLRPKPWPGSKPLIPPEKFPALIAQLEETPDATLAEHCAKWEQTQGVHVSIDAMRRAIAKVDWPLKKRPSRQRSKIPLPGPRGWRRSPPLTRSRSS